MTGRTANRNHVWGVYAAVYVAKEMSIEMPPTATATVRVFPSTRERLNALAQRAGTSAAQVVDDLLRTTEDTHMLAQFNAYFENAEAHEGLATETAAFDGAIADGLDADDARSE